MIFVGTKKSISEIGEFLLYLGIIFKNVTEEKNKTLNNIKTLFFLFLTNLSNSKNNNVINPPINPRKAELQLLIKAKGKIKGIRKYEKNIFFLSIHFSINGHKKTKTVRRLTNPLYFLTSLMGSKIDSN
tara:strand:- start:99 stop:485 length:387 start_codon:yes stop_codon:yes gene_type:complete